jgi:hypothetical protein
LYAGADREAVPSQWRRFNDMGRGAVDAVESLNRIQSGTINYRPMIRTGVLTPNILPPPAPETSHSYQSPTINLNPAEKFDLVLKINEFTSRVTIEVTDIVVADNFSYSFFGDALEMQVQSAKRSDDAVFAGLLQAGIETLTFVVEDGPWTADVNGGGPFEVAYAPMEPGLMKISFAGDFVNEQPVSFRVRVTRETFRTPLSDPISSGPIEMDDAILVPFDVPAGATQVTFDLDWGNKWDSFPTSDLDMLVYDPAMTLISEDGATGHAPERAVISAPAEGTWWVLVQGFELYTPDAYDLYATLE